MNNKFYKVLSVLFLIALIYNTITISNLKMEINNLYNNYNNIQNNLSNQINGIYGNVNTMLNKQRDILEEDDLKVISADAENYTAVIEYTAKPKVYSPAVTKATVKVNDEKFDMKYSDGVYSLQVTVPMMSTTRINGIFLEDNGTIRTQNISRTINPRYEYITTVCGDMSFNGTYSHDNRTWSIDGRLEINAEQKGKMADIAKVELVQVTNGIELLREEVTLNVHPTPDEQAATQIENDKTLAESGWTYDWYRADVKKEFKLSKGSATYLYTDVTDGEGYVHRCILDVWKTNPDGSLNDDFDFFGHGAEAVEVYNADGELIFKLEEDLVNWY